MSNSFKNTEAEPGKQYSYNNKYYFICPLPTLSYMYICNPILNLQTAAISLQ